MNTTTMITGACQHRVPWAKSTRDLNTLSILQAMTRLHNKRKSRVFTRKLAASLQPEQNFLTPVWWPTDTTPFYVSPARRKHHGEQVKTSQDPGEEGNKEERDGEQEWTPAAVVGGAVRRSTPLHGPRLALGCSSSPQRDNHACNEYGPLR